FSRDSPPLPDSRFSVFSAVGNADFNYSEVIALEDALEKAAFPHWLRVFDGRHEWAPPSVLDEALSWFRIQSLKSQRQTTRSASEDRFLLSEFAATEARAEALENSGELLSAWRE